MTCRPALVLSLLAACLSSAQTAAKRPPITGNWVDSQGNRFTVSPEAKSGNLVLECARCEFQTDDRTFERALSVPLTPAKDGALAGRDDLSNATAVIRGPQLPSGMLRLSLHLNGDAALEFAMVREAPVESSRAKPARVAVDLKQASTVMGKWVPMQVYLTDRDGNLTAPAANTLVRLDVHGGNPIPPVVRLTPAAPIVPAGVVMSTQQATLTASAPGLVSATEAATGCEEKPAAELRLKLSAPRDQGMADGRDAIPVVFSLVDTDDTPATDGKPKQFGFQVNGVGRLADSAANALAASVIAAGQCADQRKIVAQTAGTTNVSAEFRGHALSKELVFRPVLSALAIFLALFGGAVGGFVSAARNYAAARRWKLQRWTYWFLSACAGGIAVYLAYFYGLLRQLSGAPNAAGFAFLAGLIGGFLGAAALEFLQKTLTGGAPPKSAAAANP